MSSWESLEISELEREYSPSTCVDNLDVLIANYATNSRLAESRARVIKNIAYGEHGDESLDYFPASRKNAPLCIFIHGGYWQELSKNESTFAGADFVEQDINYAVLDYSLAPGATLKIIVEQCQRSIQWLYRNSGELGFSADQIYISGSSAGAHLAAMLLLTDWETYALPKEVFKGGILLSGIYDLRPLCKTYINKALKLDPEDARDLSPIFINRKTKAEAIISWGENETNEFKRQSMDFAKAWQAVGNKCSSFESAGHNHFDIVHALADPQTLLGSSVLSMING